jgi:hypothetical protein
VVAKEGDKTRLVIAPKKAARSTAVVEEKNEARPVIVAKEEASLSSGSSHR